MGDPLAKIFPEHLIKQSNILCGQLFNKKCCSQLIQNLDYPDSDCIQLFSTKLLGYAIVFGASAVKLPQVVKIFRAKSGAGIALFGVLLELMAITFNACYSIRNNFPFSAWGEAIFLGFETALIILLILWYDASKVKIFMFLLIYPLLVILLTHPTLVPKYLIWWLQSTVLPLAIGGKMIQANKNYKAQHTGQISPVTAWAMLLGSITRVYTTIRETGDLLTTITFIAAGFANGVIAFQVIYYWKLTQKFIEKGKKKKKV